MLKENEIYLGDCLDIMRNIPDKSIDLVLTDPPYGNKNDAINIKNCSSHKANRELYKHVKWNNKIEQIYFDELFRISKNQIIFGANHYNIDGNYIIWDKGQTLFGKEEKAFCSFIKNDKIYKYLWNGMIQEDMKNKQIRKHPTEKPIQLLVKILQDFSSENDLIFDGFAGSGTTALACIELNRRFICVEKDEDYYNIAKKRIEDAKSQLRLF